MPPSEAGRTKPIQNQAQNPAAEKAAPSLSMIVKKQSQFPDTKMNVTSLPIMTYDKKTPPAAPGKQTQFIPQGSKPISQQLRTS
jgi:hypothetical protein